MEHHATEQSLWEELDNMEQLLLTHNGDMAAQSHRKCESSITGRQSLSAYELAVAEGEKEELEDKLHELLTKTNDYDSQLLLLSQNNMELANENKRIRLENASLLQQVQATTKTSLTTVCSPTKCCSTTTSDSQRTCTDFEALELLLGETRSKLARSLQTLDDLSLAKDFAVRQLEQERLARVHVEKERDAYSAAYEASLIHFDKWSRAKSSINSSKL